MNSVAMSSERPTTFATASTCTGWTANNNPATSAPAVSTQRRASAATATAAPACHRTLTAWNQAVPSTSASRANPAITSGRYMWPPRSGVQYGAANARHSPDGWTTSGFNAMIGTSSRANRFQRAPR
ncbi:MAG: hypothetical protein DMD25_12735 [Gemmatimonadetes bacterium]|nr:MAG: hypothetical protein DMD57_10940 [Gemmatimonadota bacterium]PYP07368.1 MAG: hypothetical protein DMD27_01425 [Gemmatimonadota bacterium]PYP75530.1 MAG: hypothetical protein DMD25_12735 [Gemmatimonadota bacterium]